MAGSSATGKIALVRMAAWSFMLLTIGMGGCTKVINIDLNDTDKKYVIEAVLTDRDSTCQVLLSQTKNFSDNNSFAGVSGAVVTITAAGITPQTLAEASPGVYRLNSLKGMPGTTYTLTVQVNGSVFTSQSAMPVLVPFDSVYVSSRTLFSETNNFVTVKYTDPEGRGNAYRHVQYVNGIKESTLFIRDDGYSDGREVNDDLLFFSDDEDEDSDELKTGDSLLIEMQCITMPMYKYWFSLSQSATGDGNSASPANPVSNIQGGAIGYFSTHTLQSKMLIVP